MRKLFTIMLTLFLTISLGVAASDANSGAVSSLCPSNGRVTAITGSGPLPEHIYSEFPIDLTTESPSSDSSTYDSPSSVDTASPTDKPTQNTPKPHYIVDAPVTRPPNDNPAIVIDAGLYYQTPDGWQYVLDAQGNAIIVGYADKYAVSIVLPEFILGFDDKNHTVTAIGEYAFSSIDGVSPFPNLTSVVIPDTVVYIDKAAFYNCKQLNEVTLSNNLDRIYYGAFLGCNKLKKINIPDSVKDIEPFAFFDCDRLTEITLPDSVRSIETDTFGSCDQLKTVIIPESVVVIQADAFRNCGQLEIVTLPAGDMIIDKDAFRGCDSVTLRVIKNSTAHQYAVNNNIAFKLIENQTASDQQDNNLSSATNEIWEQIGTGFDQFAIAGDKLYGLSTDKQSVYLYDVKLDSWTQIGGAASQLIGGGETLYALSPFDTGSIWQYNGIPNAWEGVGDLGAQFVCAQGIMYKLSVDKEKIFQYNGKPYAWTQIGGAASQLIGGGDTLYAISPYDEGSIWRYTGTPNAWVGIGDSGAQFVCADGKLYKLSIGLDEIYQYDGTPFSWTRIGGLASKLIGGGETLYALSSNIVESVWRYTGVADAWKKIDRPFNRILCIGDDVYGFLSATQSIYHLLN